MKPCMYIMSMLTIQASRQPAFSASRQQVGKHVVGKGAFVASASRVGCS